MRGRKLKPGPLRRLHGSKPKISEPEAKGPLSEPPAWFNEEQIASWNYALAHSPRGVLAKIDRGILTIWCTSEVAYRIASEKLLAQGLTKRGVRKSRQPETVQSPYASLSSRFATLMFKAAAELGFSPVSRPRLGAVTTRPEIGGAAERDEDEMSLEEYLRRGRELDEPWRH